MKRPRALRSLPPEVDLGAAVVREPLRHSGTGPSPARQAATASAPAAAVSWSRVSHAMHRRDAKMGIASLCIGGGMGIAMTVKR